ncbi:MAG: threonylcarbamoyl-AMP synthase [Erysipelotrichaceae bacterium]|nr:threonylcarbamoyl-AMP synthase [Erysipelotrichaceae bacterium]
MAFPTDTVFGLACAMDQDAIRKVYKAKGRDFRKPLPVMCDGPEMIRRIAIVSDKAERIVERFMPGALTMVFPKREEVDDVFTQGMDTIGIRVPDDPWILDLIRELDTPIMVTSANISGNGSLLKWEDVYACMHGKINGIVTEDARGEQASTIIDVTSNEIKALREGPISIEEIKEAIE